MKRRGPVASSRIRRLTPLGYFSYDFSQYPDGPLPFGLVDAHDWIPLREDPLCIIDGAVAIQSNQGGEWPSETGSGWRGAAWRDTRTVTNNFYGRSTTAVAGPMICCVPGSTEWAIGAWLNIADLGGVPFIHYWEIGLIGRNPLEWSYLDTVWLDHDLPNTNPDQRTMEFRYVDGFTALYADGVHVAGPVPVPAVLQGSTRHGIQTDGYEQVRAMTAIEFGSYGGVLPDYSTPVVEAAGTFAKPAGTGSTVSLAYPTSPQAGDWLLAIVGYSDLGTWAASGWSTLGASAGDTSQRISMFYKIADGSESGSQTFTKTGGSAGARCGVILRISHTNPWRRYLYSLKLNAASTTVATDAISLLGIRRLGLWAAVAGADLTITQPSGYTSIGNTSAGGAAITLKLARVNLDTLGYTRFGVTGIAYAPSGTASSSTTSATVNMQIYGMPGT